MNAPSVHGCDGVIASMISRRYGVRVVCQAPGSAEAFDESRRFLSAHCETVSSAPARARAPQRYDSGASLSGATPTWLATPAAALSASRRENSSNTILSLVGKQPVNAHRICLAGKRLRLAIRMRKAALLSLREDLPELGLDFGPRPQLVHPLELVELEQLLRAAPPLLLAQRESSPDHPWVRPAACRPGRRAGRRCWRRRWRDRTRCCGELPVPGRLERVRVLAHCSSAWLRSMPVMRPPSSRIAVTRLVSIAFCTADSATPRWRAYARKLIQTCSMPTTPRGHSTTPERPPRRSPLTARFRRASRPLCKTSGRTRENKKARARRALGTEIETID